MPVDFSKFLKWSESELGNENAEEFSLRNAGSRAYYAVYHAAAARAKELRLPIIRLQGAGSHEALINAIRLSGPKGRSLADNIERVKKFRHKCDYDLGCEVSPGEAKKHVAESRRLVETLARL